MKQNGARKKGRGREGRRKEGRKEERKEGKPVCSNLLSAAFVDKRASILLKPSGRLAHTLLLFPVK